MTEPLPIDHDQRSAHPPVSPDDATRFRAALVALQSRLHGTDAKDWIMPHTDATIAVYIANVLAGATPPAP